MKLPGVKANKKKLVSILLNDDESPDIYLEDLELNTVKNLDFVLENGENTVSADNLV